MAPVVDLKKSNDSELYFNQITGRVRLCYIYQCSKKEYNIKNSLTYNVGRQSVHFYSEIPVRTIVADNWPNFIIVCRKIKRMLLYFF